MQFITCAQVGLDSLGAVELRNAVTAAFGISLPVTVTFDYPTVAALAGFVASRMGPAAAVDAGDMRDGMPAGVDTVPADGRKLRTTDIMAASLSHPSAETGGRRSPFSHLLHRTLSRSPVSSQPGCAPCTWGEGFAG